jgi:hypothetical protein
VYERKANDVKHMLGDLKMSHSHRKKIFLSDLLAGITDDLFLIPRIPPTSAQKDILTKDLRSEWPQTNFGIAEKPSVKTTWPKWPNQASRSESRSDSCRGCVS